MKVHHILAEADYVVVSKGAGRNRTFNIVDPKSGAVVGSERIRGQADAKAKNLTAKSNVTTPKGPLVAEPKTPSSKTPKSTPSVAKGGAVPPADSYGRVEPSLDKNKLGGVTKAADGIGVAKGDVPDKPDVPNAPDKPDAPKQGRISKFLQGDKLVPQNKLIKIIKGGVLGSIVSLTLGIENMLAYAQPYADALAANKGDGGHPDVVKAKINLTDSIGNMVQGALAGVASGALTAAAFSRIFILVPGFGWLATLAAGGAGYLLSVAIERLANNAGLVDSISMWLFGQLDSKLMSMVLGYVTDSTENNVRFLDESAAKAEVKDEMKAAILNDPELLKAFKMAKQIKAKQAAS